MIFDLPSIVEGYAKGYFLMADEHNNLGWFSSRQRTLIPLDNRFRYPTSLQRILNQERFTVEVDRDFLGVCRGCANRETTWISEELIEIYLALYEAGWAHSFETWQDDRLAGGILGMTIGGAFMGESMFYQIPDGSKVAMVKLVEHLVKRDFILFDVQLQNPHLERFGSYIIGDREYQELLHKALSKTCYFS
jgi:leucyl/phenylalanyl-tRNA---protein transferase